MFRSVRKDGIILEPTLGYFFRDTEDFILPEVFQDAVFPWQALGKVNAALDGELVQKNIAENSGTMKGKVHLHGNYRIGKGTVIYGGVTVIGPVLIGENCQIMPGAVIRPGTVIGSGCVIGHGCEIKHSIVLNGAKVQSMSFVGDSVIGKSARVGSGVIASNRKFDQQPITVRTDTFRATLDTAFFGCVLGDNARLGANAVTQPGTLVGPYSWVYPTTAARGFIPACKRVFHALPIAMADHTPVDLEP